VKLESYFSVIENWFEITEMVSDRKRVKQRQEPFRKLRKFSIQNYGNGKR
jgi:hypothetical protein